MTVLPSGSSSKTAGEINFTLKCSADVTLLELEGVPLPTFKWFFDSMNASLPCGVTVSQNVTNIGNNYTSTLQISFLQEHHSGLYTCRLGGNERLAANSNITVKGTIIIP